MSHAGTRDRVGGIQSSLARRSGKPNLRNTYVVVVDVNGAYGGSTGAYFPNLNPDPSTNRNRSAARTPTTEPYPTRTLTLTLALNLALDLIVVQL